MFGVSDSCPRPYEKFIQAHRETDADITVAALPMDEKCATACGLVKIVDEGRIVGFAEKPQGEPLKAMKVEFVREHLERTLTSRLPVLH